MFGRYVQRLELKFSMYAIKTALVFRALVKKFTTSMVIENVDEEFCSSPYSRR